jgi:sialic acid synthase SpsE
MRQVGDGQPCFITFEAGPTHNGLDIAKRLVTVAADAGADAIKFQIVDPDRLVSNRQQLFSYDILVDRTDERFETVSEPLYDILARRAMRDDEWHALKAHCDEQGIAFFATVAFDDELALATRLGCSTVKIASGDINHLPFIRKAARTGMYVQIDTGNATLGEIEDAVDAIHAEGSDRVIVHHCPSGYPAPPSAVNLRIIRTLKQMFSCPAAYSDHSPGWDMTIAAVTMGANLIEKTITFDRTIRGPEHAFSLEPDDAKAFVTAIRNLEAAMGSPRRLLSEEERRNRQGIRRSAFLRQAAAAGARLDSLDVEFRRPGYGLGPDQFERLAEAKLRYNLPTGHMLTPSDVA